MQKAKCKHDAGAPGLSAQIQRLHFELCLLHFVYQRSLNSFRHFSEQKYWRPSEMAVAGDT